MILESKLQIPVRPGKIVLRSRLIDLLEERIIDFKLVLVTSPAGFGKTTLLADWARTSSIPVAWLSLAREDDSIESFLRHLFAAWARVQPDIVNTSLDILLGSETPESSAVLTAFINVASRTPNHVVIILDDYHFVEDAAIQDAVTFLLDYLPLNLHFILVSRSEPPLALARYRARSELLEIRAEDLQFTQDETAMFLRQMMGLELRADEVASLHTDTEGWIAGLQLAALSLRNRQTGTDRIRSVRGRHRFIADYLADDVLKRLPVNLQQFLLKTSILDRLCGSLCEEVTGMKGGQDTLQRLERENLFLIPLDNSREWFRYHRLFADFLHEELKRLYPEEITQLHRQAAQWYLAHDLPEDAFRHAVAGNDSDLVVQIGEHYFDIKLLSGEFNVLNRWLNSLPEEWHTSYPLIGLFQAGLSLFTGELDAGARQVDKVEQSLRLAENEDAHWSLARISAMRCAVACFQNNLGRAESYADQALQDLPEEDHTFRAAVFHALGDTYRRNERWEQAKASYLKVLELTHEPAFRIRSAHVFGALADLELQQGRLRESATLWRKALAVIQARDTWGSFPLPLIGWVYIRLSEILYEWNELSEAGDLLSQGLERAELGGDVRAMIAGHLMAARLKLTAGDSTLASEHLEGARPLVENAPFPDWLGRFGRFQLELWLAQDKLRAAVDGANKMLQDARLNGSLERETAQLAMARVMLTKGDKDSLEQAMMLLARLIGETEGEGRTAVHIESLALQSLVAWKQVDLPGALTLLQTALNLAESQGYTRLFADLGLPMARLLQEAHARSVMPHYVEKLLDAFRGDLSNSPAGNLPEPLTPREREVLELIAAGLTNDEIAERLILSPETVKKHTGNIYGKLGVHSRTQAVARAREWKMLS